jgi:hypothetical protein
MMLGAPTANYDARDQAQLREALRRADSDNQKRGRDIYFGDGLGRLIYVDTTGARYSITFPVGVATATLLP